MIRLAIRCRPEHAEIVLAELLELAPGGVEEDASNPGPPPELWGDDDGREDQTTNVPSTSSAARPGAAGSAEGSTGGEPATDPVDPGREAEESTGIGGWVEYAIYGAPGELPELPELRAVVGEVPIEIETTEIPDDWADRWRDFHEPAVIAGGRLVVRPSWIEADADPAQEISVVIDPGQAFGTGAHATTRLTLELLLELADGAADRGPLVDLGTGSAVIAIAAAKLGWGPVTAIDHERAAVAAARENARLNGAELTVERLNLRQSPPPAAPTITANLTAPLLGLVARWWSAEPELLPRRLVCSGLLLSEAEEVAQAFGEAGMGVAESRASGDWGALLLEAR